MKKILFIGLMMFFLTGCAAQRFDLRTDQYLNEAAYEGTNHFVFWGLKQVKVRNPQEACLNRPVLAVETSESFLDGVARIATLGIYYPETYKIYCGRPIQDPVLFWGVLEVQKLY